MKYTAALILPFLFLAAQMSAQFSDPKMVLSPFPVSTASVSVDNIDHTGSTDFLVYGSGYTFRWFSYDHGKQWLLPREFAIDTTVGTIRSVHKTDIDSDGDQDYVAIDQSAGQIILLEKSAFGGELRHHLLEDHADARPSIYWELRSGDLDQNGLMDIVAVENGTTPELVVYLQTADLVFERSVISTNAGGFQFLHIRDMDQDDDLDIFVTSGSFRDQLIVFENTGESANNWPSYKIEDVGGTDLIRVADMNGDDILDLVKIRYNNLYWYEGLGNKSYQRRFLLEDQDNYSFIITDMNHDDRQEILLIGTGSDYKLSILWHNGDDFERTFLTEGSSSATQVIVQDFDQDGRSEILLGHQHWQLLQYNSSSGFYEFGGRWGPAEIQQYLFYDLDKDDDLDAMIKDRFGIMWLENVDGVNNRFSHISRNYRSYGNLGSGIVEPNDRVESIDIYGDPNLDADENFELLVKLNCSYYNTGTLYQSKFVRLDHQGDFSFSRSAEAAATIDFSNFTHLADLNNDGQKDLINYNLTFKLIYALPAGAASSYEEPRYLITDPYDITMLSSADMDMDGDQDVIFDDGQLHWITNEDNGIGDVVTVDYLPGTASQIAAVDVDKDGDMDLIKAYRNENVVRVLKNNGSNTFDQHERFENSRSFVLSDLDSDGWPDLIVKNRFYRNLQGNFSSDPLFFQPTPSLPPSVVDLDQDGGKELLLLSDNNVYLIRNFLQAPTIKGYAFSDDNQNGLRDSLENGLYNVRIAIKGTDAQWETFSNDIGEFFQYMLPDDSYDITAEQLEYWDLTTAGILTSEIAQSTDSTVAFGYYPTEAILEGQIYLSGQLIRCNQSVNIGISVHNTGTLEGDLMVRMQHDPRLTFDRSEQLPSQIDADQQTITWQINDLPPFQQKQFDLSFLPIDATQLGTELNFQVELFAIHNGDTTALDDATYNDVIRCAYDPNDKLVSPNRPDKSILPAEQLIYTIRFQNTGNDTAFQVILRDTLDALLDAKSIRPVSTSHPYTLTVIGQNIEVLFQNILLPDSTTNLAASMGFFQFTVELSGNALPGDQIQNTAAIYFDLNEPIITNTTISNLALPNATGDLSAFGSFFKVFPNPAKKHLQIEWPDAPIPPSVRHYQIVDIHGRILLRTTQAGARISLPLNNLELGTYFVQALYPDGRLIGVRKFVRQ